MRTVFHMVGDIDTACEDSAEERLSSYLGIIEEPRQARERFDSETVERAQSLYLRRSQWNGAVESVPGFDLDFEETRDVMPSPSAALTSGDAGLPW